MSEPKTLHQTWTKSGHTHEIVLRRNNVVLTRVLFKDDKNPQGEVAAYEVFYVKVQQAGTRNIGGVDVEFEAKEIPPSNEDFGKTAWCYGKRGFQKACEKFEEISGYDVSGLVIGAKKVVPEVITPPTEPVVIDGKSRPEIPPSFEDQVPGQHDLDFLDPKPSETNNELDFIL